MHPVYFILCCMTLFSCLCANLIQGQEVEDEGLRSVFLQSKKAKSVLRVRRVWIKRIWEEEEEEEEDYECGRNCHDSWGPWSSCDMLCGPGALQHRNRSLADSCIIWAKKNECSGDSSMSVSCNKTCQHGSTPTVNNCACTPGFKGPCCENIVTCKEPSQLEHGQVIPSGKAYVYSVVIMFKCDSGYRLLGTAGRTCTQDGTWSGQSPVCTLINCLDPGIPLNGHRVGTQMVVGSQMVFECNSGFLLQGESSLTCKEDGTWTGVMPTSVFCARPAYITNGWIRVPNKLMYGQIVTYGCHLKYYLEGPKRRVCRADGTWSGGQPRCSEIEA